MGKAPQGRVARGKYLVSQALHPSECYVWDKEDLLDTIYWARVALAVGGGVVCGVAPFTGIVPFAGFCATNSLGVIAWYRKHNIDEDDYGGIMALVGEAFPISCALFVLCWIITYSLVHF